MIRRKFLQNSIALPIIPFIPVKQTKEENLKVWLLTVDHEYGNDYWLFSSYDKAIIELAKYCKEWWDELDIDIEIDNLTDNNKIVDIYFSSKSQEGCGFYETYLIREVCRVHTYYINE